MEAYGKTVWPGEEEQTFKRLMGNWNTYVANMGTFNNAMLVMDKETAHPILKQSLQRFESIESDINKLIDILQGAMGGLLIEISFGRGLK